MRRLITIQLSLLAMTACAPTDRADLSVDDEGGWEVDPTETMAPPARFDVAVSMAEGASDSSSSSKAHGMSSRCCGSAWPGDSTAMNGE